jgi:hypothetical protein
MERTPISWIEAEPDRVELEKCEMADRAPEMAWREGEELPNGGFEGLAPEWPFARDPPEKLDKLTEGKQLSVQVRFFEGYPAQPPRLFALDPEPSVEERLREEVHVNGDGSICLILHPSDWSSSECAVELVTKASGWFLEYLAVGRGLIGAMSPAGMFASTELDAKIEEL